MPDAPADELPTSVNPACKVAALTPPTSEDHNDKEDSSSELSELDLEDEDDIGEVEPDHYFEGGKIPVFKPVRSRNVTISSEVHMDTITIIYWLDCVILIYLWCGADNGPIPELQKVY